MSLNLRPLDRRQRRAETDWMKIILAGAAFLALAGLILIRVMIRPLPDGAAQTVDMAIGIFLGAIKDLFNWTFGSSKAGEEAAIVAQRAAATPATIVNQTAANPVVQSGPDAVNKPQA